MSEAARSSYRVASEVRTALSTDLFPPGEYQPRGIIETLIKSDIVKPWEISATKVSVQARKTPGWAHNGGNGHASILIKAVPPPPPEPVQAPPPVECGVKEGTFTRRIERMERMIERLCLSLQIETE
jgi:hypothetical protein